MKTGLTNFLTLNIRILQYLIAFFSIILNQNYIFAVSNELTKKELTINLDKDFEWKNTFEDEIRKLTNRIEFLEHEIQKLKHVGVDNSEEIATKKKNMIEKSIFELTDKEKSVTENKPMLKESNNEGKKLYELALAALKEKKYVEAGKKIKEFIDKNPNSLLLSNAYYWYGESYLKQNDHGNAAINYLKGYKSYPKGEKAADSLLKLAYSLEKLEKKEEARKVLLKLKEEFPKRSASQIKATEDALERIGVPNKQ